MESKRIGHAAMETFLLLNGFEITAEIDEQERLFLALAAGDMDREQFNRWVESHAHKRQE
jgi:death-on-curing protein